MERTLNVLEDKRLAYESMTETRTRLTRTPLVRRWLIETGPLGCMLIAVWVKLVYFSALVPSEWWAPDESIKQWMRPAFYVVRSLLSHPHILSATLAILLLFVALLPLSRRSWRFTALLLLNLTLTTLGVADLVHVRFYADVLSASDLILAPALSGLLPSILKLLRPTDALYYVDVVIACAAFPFYVSHCRCVPSLDRATRARLSVALAVVGLVLAVPTAWMVGQNGRELFGYTSVRIEAASTLGILPYHLSDIVVHLTTTPRKIDEAERERVRRFLSRRDHEASVSPLAGIARGRNVIVISAESLQAFPIGLQINGQLVTPRLSAFAKESLHFVNFYDQTHLGTTSDGEFMAMQSLHPLPAGVLVSHFHHHTFRGLPKILSEHGYATLSMCAASSDFWYMDQMHPRLGFQKSYFDESYKMVEQINLWLSDREFFSQSMAKLTAQRGPFMAFLLSASNHHPYRLPHAYRTLKLGKIEGTLVGDYLHSVHYFDRAFGEFIDNLRDAGLLDKTLILLYGDHQGFLGDPPELAGLLGFPESDQFRLVRTRKNVPLLIRLPYGREAGVRSNTGGHLDIAPTLLSLLGIADDTKVMLGSDLTQKRDSLVVFRDGSFIDGRGYFMKRLGHGSGGACYDIEAGRPISCEAVELRRATATERLEISDMIVRGDLIPALTSGNGEAPPGVRRIKQEVTLQTHRAP
jgi:phosphoglycerol transferase MdoB-like AlkP superfamily enzyme